MPEQGGFTPPEATVSKQLVPNYASFFGESIMPPSDEGKKLTPQEFQKQFPVRYDIWETLSKNVGAYQEADVSIYNPNQIQKLKTRLHILNQLDRYVSTHHVNENGRTLWNRQMTVFEDIRNHAEKGGTEGYIKLPTGTGKTVLFTELTEATDLKTLIVTSRQNLVDQAVEKFQEYAPDMQVGRIYAHAKERGRQVEITTYESLLIGIENDTIHPDEYDLLVLDETHRGLTPRREEAIQQFTSAIKIGFTATPNYDKEKRVSNLLGTEIHTMTIREAVEERMLSPFSVIIARTNTDITNVTVAANGEYNQRELEKAINNKERNTAAVQIYEQLMADPKNHDQLSIAYCAGIQHANDLAFEFQRIGVKAVAIHSNLTRDERRQILQDYENGRIEVLCNAQMLIEGFDNKPTGIILNVAPTASVVNAEQRSGRGLRLDENNPGKHAIIVDIIDQTSSRQFTPISFAQIVNGAYAYPPHREHEARENHDIRNGLAIIPKIEVEGIEVITNPEEVMRLVHQMQEIQKENTYKPPEGSMMVGDLDRENTIGYIVNKSRQWVKARLPSVLKWLEEQQKIQDMNKPLYEVVRSKKGKIAMFYSPLVIEKIKQLADQEKSPPEGWFPIGHQAYKGTLIHEINKSSKWVRARLPLALKALEEQQKDIPEGERKQYVKKFLTKSGNLTDFYSPDVFKKLQELENKPTTQVATQEGWMFIDSIAGELKKSAEWVQRRLEQILQELEEQQKNIPETEREPLFKKSLGKHGREVTYYSPVVINILKQHATDGEKSPQGWMLKGSSIFDRSDTITIIKYLNKSRIWLQKKLPLALKALEEQQKDIPEGERKQYVKKFLTKNGNLTDFYSPDIIKKLAEFAEKEEQ